MFTLPPWLKLEFGVEETGQQSPKRRRSQGGRKALGQRDAGTTARDYARRCPSSSNPQATCNQKHLRLRPGQNTLEQTHTGTTQRRIAGSTQAARSAENRKLISKLSCSNQFGSLIVNILISPETLQCFLEKSWLYASFLISV